MWLYWPLNPSQLEPLSYFNFSLITIIKSNCIAVVGSLDGYEGTVRQGAPIFNE